MSARRGKSPGGLSSLHSTMNDSRADYLAGKIDPRQRPRRGLPSLGSSGDYHARNANEFNRMREVARDADRNDVLIPQAVNRAVDNQIGTGFKLNPTTGSEDLDAKLLAKWNAWASDPSKCDVAREHSFADIEHMTMRAVLVDGDIFAIPTSSGALEMVEGHRAQTPSNTVRNVVHGVLLSPVRERLEYWFTRSEIDPYKQVQRVADVRQIAARTPSGNPQVFHIYNPRRVSETRGVTALAPAFATLSFADDINYAHLVKAQVASMFAILRTFKDGATDVPIDGAGLGDTSSAGREADRPALEPGMEYQGVPGEELSAFSPNVPNSEFFQHMRLMIQMIGLNLGLPLIVLLLDASETNFSGWRGAFEQAKTGFRRNQGWMERRFHRPVYAWKVRQWLAEDRELRALAEAEGVDAFSHKWNKPAWPYLEPFKDAQADKLRERSNLSSMRRIVGERGHDYDELVPEIVGDRGLMIREAIKVAKAINDEHPGAGVRWRELAGEVATAEKIAEPTDNRDERPTDED